MAIRKNIFSLAFVVVTILAYSRASPTTIEPNAEHNTVCQTEECHKIATDFVGSMDQSVEPCDNFYQFTCGKWETNNPLPPSATKWNRLEMYRNLVAKRLSEILEKEPNSMDIEPVKKAKMWYRSCMDAETLERRGIEPIASIVTQAGGWPLALADSNWNYVDHPWQQIEQHYAQVAGYNVFYDVLASAPLTESSPSGEIYIIPSELLVKRKELMGTDWYRNFLKSTIKLFVQHNGNAVSPKTYEQEAKQIYIFERELVKLIDAGELKMSIDPSDRWLPFDSFVDTYKSNATKVPAVGIDWQRGIQRLFDPLKLTVHHKTNTGVKNVEYIKGLSALLDNTPPRTIANYVHWNFIATTVIHTTEHMRNELFNATFERLFAGVKERPPRWLECTNEMKMTYAAAYAYSEKHFSAPAQNATREMLNDIKMRLDASFDHSTWFHGYFKIIVDNVLKAMTIFSNYPEWYNNGTAVSNYYKELTIGTDYIDNVLSYMRFERRQKLRLYALPPRLSTNDPATSMDSTNAQYDSSGYFLEKKPTIFEWPLSASELPDNVNYGRLSFLVGYEIGFGYDSIGNQENKRTRSMMVELSVNVLNSYYQRGQCFDDLFYKYTARSVEPPNPASTSKTDNLAHGSNATESEITADSTGLQVVFQAYKDRKEKNGSDRSKLRGLEKFTDDQLFFIAFGAFSCGSERSVIETISRENSHSPGHLRVNGAVSNTNDFAKVFNCPIGSPMNPIDKCKIWKKSGATPGIV